MLSIASVACWRVSSCLCAGVVVYTKQGSQWDRMTVLEQNDSLIIDHVGDGVGLHIVEEGQEKSSLYIIRRCTPYQQAPVAADGMQRV